MKVAMVTPMTPESAIADVMSQAMPGLAAEWDLDIWCPAAPALRPSPAPLVPFGQPGAETLAKLSAYDLVVYVLGDSHLHHQILPLARRLPGLVVLHDASLTNLVLYTAMVHNKVDALADYVRDHSGSERAEFLRSPGHRGGTREWLQLCSEIPLTEIAVQNALGAVVHSQWHAAQVDGLLLGDVAVAPLPVPSQRIGFEASGGELGDQLLAGLSRDAVLLVTVGSVNANRGLHILLESIAGDEALSNVHLWAVGPADGPAGAEAHQLARELGVDGRFAATGRVSDALLGRILQRSDVAAALRRPVLEGQSASVLTQMLAGRPVLVYDHAHYSELPDDAVVKVAYHEGIDGVRAALRQLTADPDGRRLRGERARDYVLTTRSGSAYASALLLAGERALASKPRAHLVQDLGTHLRRLGFDKDPAVLERVTELAFDMFDLA